MINESTISTEIKPITENTVISLKNVSKSFGDNHVLNKFTFDLKKGESVVVLGKSGSGKSVLIKCIIGLMKPDEGEILVLGNNIPDLDSNALDKLRVKIGFLFQSNALYDSMTVRENLEFPLRRHRQNIKNEEVDELVIEALTNVGLAHTVDSMPSELSGGMRKRIALARTLILKPEIILYDEPTTGLDPITSKEIINLMLALQKKYHSSSMIISHDMKCVQNASDKIIMLIEGKCHLTGTYSEMIKSEDPKVKQFFL